jgi:asparagine synthase (glutamine-hydrolysing)
MCGLLGVVGNNVNKLDKEFSTSLHSLLSRGPDQTTKLNIGHRITLGFTRLAIVDAAKSIQPMSTKDNKVHLLFNGEIYNFKDLKTRFLSDYEFKTEGDSEVVLAMYSKFGENFNEYLIGMYSIAIIDQNKTLILLARDKFGEKPMFFEINNDRFIFGSTIMSILNIIESELELDYDAIIEYLRTNYFRQDPIVKGIKSVLPGTIMMWNLDTFEFIKSLKLSAQSFPKYHNSRNSQKQLIAECVSKIEEAVKISLTGDVQPDLLFSSGIDSTLVAAYLGKIDARSNLYTLDFEDKSYSEFKSAELTSRKIGKEIKKIDFSYEVLPNISDLVAKMGEPLGDSSVLALWVLTDNLSKLGVKSCLTGDGGDELLLGYKSYKATKFSNYLPVPSSVSRLINSLNISQYIKDGSGKVGFRTQLKRFCYGMQFEFEYRHLMWSYAWSEEDIKKMVMVENLPEMQKIQKNSKTISQYMKSCQIFDIENYLQKDILVKSDRTSMANSVELRAPLLDKNLSDFLLTEDIQNINQRLGRKYGPKGLFKYILESEFGIDMKKNHKKGFSVPIDTIIRKRYAGEIIELFNNIEIENLFFDKKFVVNKFDEHMNGKTNNGFAIWGLATLISWLLINKNKINLVL